jgi:hypothetical protein
VNAVGQANLGLGLGALAGACLKAGECELLQRQGVIAIPGEVYSARPVAAQPHLEADRASLTVDDRDVEVWVRRRSPGLLPRAERPRSSMLLLRKILAYEQAALTRKDHSMRPCGVHDDARELFTAEPRCLGNYGFRLPRRPRLDLWQIVQLHALEDKPRAVVQPRVR